VWFLQGSPTERGDDDDGGGGNGKTASGDGVALGVVGAFAVLGSYVAYVRTGREPGRPLPPAARAAVAAWALALGVALAYLAAAYAVQGLAAFASLSSLQRFASSSSSSSSKGSNDNDDDDGEGEGESEVESESSAAAAGTIGGAAPLLVGLFVPALAAAAVPLLDDAAAVATARVSPSHPTRIQRRALAALASLGAAVPLLLTAVFLGPPLSTFRGADTTGTWVCLVLCAALAAALTLADIASAAVQMRGE
jgi:hypothetical protein